MSFEIPIQNARPGLFLFWSTLQCRWLGTRALIINIAGLLLKKAGDPFYTLAGLVKTSPARRIEA